MYLSVYIIVNLNDNVDKATRLLLPKEVELKTEEFDNLNSKYNTIQNVHCHNNQLFKSMQEHQDVLRTPTIKTKC